MDQIVSVVLGFLHLSPSMAVIISSGLFFCSEILGKFGHGGVIQMISNVLVAASNAFKPKG